MIQKKRRNPKNLTRLTIRNIKIVHVSPSVYNKPPTIMIMSMTVIVCRHKSAAKRKQQCRQEHTRFDRNQTHYEINLKLILHIAFYI